MTIACTLPAEPASVPVARRFVCQTLVDWDAAAACEIAEMLVSEIATNAVLHARTPFTVEVSRDGHTIRVCVLDLSPAPARLRKYGADSTTGRGLRLVASLALQWGVLPQGRGKAIWFEIDDGGNAAAVVPAWDEELDMDALLAQFDDDDSGAVASSRQGWSGQAA